MAAVWKDIIELFRALRVRELEAAGVVRIGRDGDVAVGADGRRAAEEGAAEELFAVTPDAGRVIRVRFDLRPLERHRRLRVRHVARQAVVEMLLALVLELRPIGGRAGGRLWADGRATLWTWRRWSLAG